VIGDLSFDDGPWRKPVIADVLEDVTSPGAGDLHSLDRPAVYVDPDVPPRPHPPEASQTLHDA
jgi:hypothetical protein